MFERFTDPARQVVVLAQEEARALRHNYIGTEHILLGLLREEEGIAARVLESLDITVEPVRAQVVQIVGSGEEATSGQIPFTPRAKKVLELALREALALGHNNIGPEHILLGLIRENEGVASESVGVAIRILLDFDAHAEKIRNAVIRMLPGPEARAQAAVTRASSVSSETSIHVNPSAIVRRLLRSGAARARRRPLRDRSRRPAARPHPRRSDRTAARKPRRRRHDRTQHARTRVPAPSLTP